MNYIYQLFIVTLCITCLLFAVSATAQSVVNTTVFNPPGVTNNVGFDFETAVVQDTGLVYVGATGAYGNEVGVIDPVTKALVSVIPVSGTGALGFSAVNQTTHLVYFRQLNAAIVIIDGRPSSATFNQALTSLAFPSRTIQSFALDETRGLLYVTNNNSSGPLQSRVTIIDVDPANPTFHQIVSEILLPTDLLARGLDANTATNKIYVATTGGPGAGIYVLDGASLSLALIPGTVSAFGVIVNEIANLVYAPAPGNLLRAIDGATDSTLTAIPLPGVISPGTYDERLEVNTATGHVYVLSSEAVTSGKLIVVDGNRLSPTFNTVLNSINVGRQASSGVAVDEALNRIVVSSFLDHQTLIIDGASQAVLATIRSKQGASDVAFDPATHRAYIANQLNFVQEIDVASATLEATIVTAAEAGQGAVNLNNNLFYVGRTVANTEQLFFDKCGSNETVTGLPHDSGRYVFTAVNRVTNRIYALNAGANLSGDAGSVPGFTSVIDGNTNTVIANVEVGNGPFGMVVNEATNKIYVANAGFGTDLPGGITVIDGATNMTVTADTSAFPANAQFFTVITVNETTNRVYFQFTAGSVRGIGVLDGATNIASQLPASIAPVSAIGVNRVLNRIYIVSSGGRQLHVLDGSSDALITTIPLGSSSPAPLFANNIAVNESTGRVFVTNFNDDALKVIDGTSNSVLATITVGDGPVSVRVNELTNRAYISNRLGRTISFVDAESVAVEATLAVPLSPGVPHVDPAVSRIFVSTGDGDELSGVMVVSDVDGTFDALRQLIIAATVGDPPDIRKSMLAKLDQAEEKWRKGKFDSAIDKLEALGDKVEAQRGTHLTNAEANRIQALISAILNSTCGTEEEEVDDN